jgi:hypothetical protein
LSETTSNRSIPLIQTVREIDGMAQVWFEGSGGVVLPVTAGDFVTIRGRVYEVKRAGGYTRAAGESPMTGFDRMGVQRREAFTLDLGEIFLELGTGSIPDLADQGVWPLLSERR